MRDSAKVAITWTGVPRLRGFTLVELVVVIALIAAVTVMGLGSLKGGGDSRALQSARSALAGIITVARTKAVSSGQTCRVMVNIDPTSRGPDPRFLRYLVVQAERGGTWETLVDLHLPSGVYLVPGDISPLPTGLFAEGSSAWVRVDGLSPLRSTVLRSNQVTTETVNAGTVERWVSFSFAGAGTTVQAGDLVLALGSIRPPASYADGESPVVLANPENVCGVTLSSYGLAVLIGDRAGF